MSPFPKCPVCSHPHAAGAKHKFDDEPVVTIAAQEKIPPAGKSGNKLIEISRENPGRGVTASATDPVTVGFIKRDDEVEARRTSISPSELSQPSHIFQGGNIEAKKAFDDTARAKYQRWFMRDQPKAKAEGLKVKAWRKKHNIDWRQYPDE